MGRDNANVREKFKYHIHLGIHHLYPPKQKCLNLDLNPLCIWFGKAIRNSWRITLFFYALQWAFLASSDWPPGKICPVSSERNIKLHYPNFSFPESSYSCTLCKTNKKWTCPAGVTVGTWILAGSLTSYKPIATLLAGPNTYSSYYDQKCENWKAPYETTFFMNSVYLWHAEFVREVPLG